MVNSNQSQVFDEVAALEALDHKGLDTRYQDLTGEPPPERIGRTLLKLAVAYEILRKPHRERVCHVA